MKTIKKLFRPFDIIIIVLLLVLSLVPSWIFAANNAYNESSNLYAVISVGGEELDRFLLTGNTEHQLITYEPAPGQYNIVEIDGERIRNKEDNSPRQVAVSMDWIEEPGQTIINVPHQFMIEIVSENPGIDESEVDIIA